MNRRVAVTGVGVIAPNGNDAASFWASLMNGFSGIGPITLFDASSYPTRIAGEVKGFDPAGFMDRKQAKRMARFSQFAVVCARMAVADAGLDQAALRRLDPLLSLGVSGTDVGIVEEQQTAFLRGGLRRVNPYSSFMSLPNAAAGEVAGAIGVRGPNVTVSTGCASGLDAVGAAYRAVALGERRAAVAGGADAPVTPLMLASLCAAGIMSKANDRPERASRPFDRLRDGGVLSEGGAVVVLEELACALRRGAPVYGEIAGYGQSVESRTEEPGSGLLRAIVRAFEDADADARDVDYVSAHAPSDPLLDRWETAVLKRVLGPRAYAVPVSSIKGHIGNPYSAAGVLQTVATLMAMREGTIPPTLNHEEPDPECDLDCVPNRPRLNRIGTALVDSHGFGGANSALVLRRRPC